MTFPPVIDLSPDALFRVLIVHQVHAHEARGASRADAVRAVVAVPQTDLENRYRPVSRRSVYRWLATYEAQGWAGLEDKPRKAEAASRSLDSSLLAFFAEQKADDPRASVPELIRRARLSGMVEEGEQISRNTVWKALRRLGLDTRRARQPRTRDVRRFLYPHRMQLVLVDGKHFRAGRERLRRVAIFFLDDATRFGLDVVVGPSETSLLFLHGLYLLVRRAGLPDALYADRGASFTAHASVAVVIRLGPSFVFGQSGYPEAHGGIERFNRTANEQAIRFLASDDVDPDCASLSLRLRHWLHEVYNHTPHERLGLQTPWQRWSQDPRPLTFPDSEDALRRAFVLPLTRHASADNVVSVDGVEYELPLGHAGQDVLLHQHLLEGRLTLRHEDQDLTLQPVDLALNAMSPRAPIPHFSAMVEY